MNELARGSLPDEAALWQLLCRTARSYTQGDSDSLPEETMEELLRSPALPVLHAGALWYGGH